MSTGVIDYEQLVAVTGDAIVVSDIDGAITVWNAAAERIFGFTAEEAIGKPLDLITPERHQARHWQGYAKTVETGVTRYGATLLKVPALHKEGGKLSIAFTVALLKDADGKVTGVAAVIRDETARWEEERRLRKELSELKAGATAQAETTGKPT